MARMKSVAGQIERAVWMAALVGCAEGKAWRPCLLGALAGAAELAAIAVLSLPAPVAQAADPLQLVVALFV